MALYNLITVYFFLQVSCRLCGFVNRFVTEASFISLPVHIYINCFLTSLNFPHLHFVVRRHESWHANVFRLLPSLLSCVVMWLLAMSSFTRSRHLNFGLPLFLFPFTDICNIFLVASSLSRLCTCPNHLNLFYLRNSAIGFTCAFSRCQHLFT